MDTSAIVDAALEIVSHQGLDALSIRSVATRLGISHMSVYRFVESKDDLLDAIVLRVLERTEVPHSVSQQWDERVIALMAAWRKLLLDNSEIVPLLFARPIPMGSEGLVRLQEAILANLQEAGIEGPHAVRSFWQIFTLTLGHVMFELPRRRLHDEDMGNYAAALSGIAQERGFERVFAAAPQLASISGRGTFEEMLAVLLAGIKATFDH